MPAGQTGLPSTIEPPVISLEWLLGKTEYVEWIYGLRGLLGEKEELKTLFDIFNPIFGMDVPHYSQIFYNIKKLKKGRRQTVFDMQNLSTKALLEKSDMRQPKK
jgi:hypothetical protein